jgi:polyhydroxyalkanoate synthesis regulator phasin
MTEEGKITMSEFKTVVEQFKKNQQKIVEVMQHEFGNVKEQIALLHEGQTAIRMELRQKPSLDIIEELERRVTRLENKVA